MRLRNNEGRDRMTQQPTQDSATPPAPAKRSTALIWVIVVGVVILVAAAAIAAVMLLNPEPPPTEELAATPEPTVTTQAETIEPAAIVISNCAALNPIAQAENDTFIEGTDIENSEEIGRDVFDMVFGPVAQTTMDEAQQTQGCQYIFSYHDGLNQFTSEVPEAGQAALIQAVEADADFIESEYRGAKIFSWGEEITDGPVSGSSYTVHSFIDDVWIAQNSFDGSGTLMSAAIDAMIEANPQLAD